MLDKYVKHAWDVIRNVPRHGEESLPTDATEPQLEIEGGKKKGGRYNYANKIAMNDNLKLN